MTLTATHERDTRTDAPPARTLAARRALGLVIILGALALLALLSIGIGANPLSIPRVWHGLWHRGDGTEEAIIVWTMRGPRTVIGIMVGAAFGVAGALIQALTRNPLADPGILGVNAGAGFTVTLGVGVLGVSGIQGYIWFAFVGAALATVTVYMIGAMGRAAASSVTLVLAGVALAAVLNGISTFLTLIDPDTFRSIRNWGLGSLARTSLSDATAVLVFIAVGLVLAVLLSGPLNSIAMGDDLAASLGTNVPWTRILSIVAITLLAGSGTALTGGIAFVGLMVPHIVRWIVGPDQRWIILYSALFAPVVLLSADILGRVLGGTGEIEAGILTAVIGAPALIVLVRRKKASGL